MENLKAKKLGVLFDTIKKNQDLTISSVIPTQKNLLKTFLWINMTVIIIVLSIYSKHIQSWTFIVSLIFAIIGIVLSLYTLTLGRTKKFGNYKPEFLEDKYSYEEYLTHLVNETYRSFDHNFTKVIEKRAKILSKITWLTIFTVIFTTSISIYEGGKYMADDKTKETSTIQPTTDTRDTNDQKK